MSDDGASGEIGDLAAMAPAARLLGRLLVRELDADTLAELAEPELAASLEACGIKMPGAAALPELAHEWCRAFLHPEHGMPLVQSLWVHGQYDGDANHAVTTIARAAGCELAVGARGAPADHLGCILLLWADLIETEPELALVLQRDHLPWALRALPTVAAQGGFYGDVAKATQRFVTAVAEV